jgi:hypothetical protein
MKVTINGRRLYRLLEAAEWGRGMRSANVKKKVNELLAQRGGTTRLARYIADLADFAEQLRGLSLTVEVTETDPPPPG